jgi:hypothetical protein
MNLLEIIWGFLARRSKEATYLLVLAYATKNITRSNRQLQRSSSSISDKSNDNNNNNNYNILCNS